MIAAVRASGPVIVVCLQVGQVRVLCRVLVAGFLGWGIVSCVCLLVTLTPSRCWGQGALPPPLPTYRDGKERKGSTAGPGGVLGRGGKGSEGVREVL